MKKILYTELQIKKNIWHQADRINEKFSQLDMKELYIISILNGAFIYTADLVRSLTCPTVIDFMKITSYNGKSGGTPKITMWPKFKSYADIILLDDILDRGHTIIHAVEYLQVMKPKSISVFTMLHKMDQKEYMQVYFDKHFIFADLGLPVKDWVYGFGLDNNDLDRNLKSINIV